MVLAAASLSLGQASPPAAQEPARAAPDGPWLQYADPAQAGWAPEGLELARRKAVESVSAAVLVVQSGHVVAAWGALDFPFKTASIRKSLYSLVCGILHDRGRFELEKTVGELGLDDLQPLTEVEKTARVRDLMAARSGVYHPSAYETESNLALRPPRGSVRPNELWNYNNWDFNAVPVAFERLAGMPLAQAFEELLARPLGLEDFDASLHVFSWLEPSLSRFPALLFRLSARDLARIGVLVLDEGTWRGTRLVSAEWIRLSTSPITVFEAGHDRREGNGYGLMWWVLPARPAEQSVWERHHRIAAKGAGGHLLAILPELDVVIVHRPDTDSGGGVSDARTTALYEALLQARRGAPAPAPLLAPLAPQPLGGAAPRPLRLRSPVPAARVAAVEGRWEEEQGDGALTLFAHEARLFVRREGGRILEAELFLDGSGHLYSPEAPVEIEVLEEEGAKATAIAVTAMGRRSIGLRAGSGD